MKTIVRIILVMAMMLICGCKEESNPTVPEINGRYSGNFTVTIDSYVQKGTVTFVFGDSSYEQTGQIQSPSTASISDKGIFKISDGSYLFNPGRELQFALYPAWSLMGTFNSQKSSDSITFVQESGSSRYEIQLHKIK